MADDRDVETELMPEDVQLVSNDNHFTMFGGVKEQGDLLQAVQAAKDEFPEIVNDVQGMMGNRTYKYADLNILVKATTPALTKHGVSVTQFMFGPVQLSTAAGQSVEVHRILTIIAGHGAQIHSAIDYRRAGDIKAWGGQTTYIRRYAYRSILQLDGTDDPDSTDVQTGPRANTQAAPPQRQQRPPERRQEPPRAARANLPGDHEPPAEEPQRPKPTPKPEPKPEEPLAAPAEPPLDEARPMAQIPEEPKPRPASNPPPAVMPEGFERNAWLRRLHGAFHKLGIQKKEIAIQTLFDAVGKRSSTELTDRDVVKAVQIFEDKVAKNGSPTSP